MPSWSERIRRSVSTREHVGSNPIEGTSIDMPAIKDPTECSVKGNVVKQLVAVGSKSERMAYLIETDIGPLFLRRRGGSAFHDEALEALVGKTIEAKGVLHKKLFIVHSWEFL